MVLSRVAIVIAERIAAPHKPSQDSLYNGRIEGDYFHRFH